MKITPEEKKEFCELITESVVAALKQDSFSCHLSEDAQKEVGHFFGMLRDVSGDGTHASGIEVFRTIALRNNRYVRWSRRVEAALLATATGWVLVKLFTWLFDKIKGGA